LVSASTAPIATDPNAVCSDLADCKEKKKTLETERARGQTAMNYAYGVAKMGNLFGQDAESKVFANKNLIWQRSVYDLSTLAFTKIPFSSAMSENARNLSVISPGHALAHVLVLGLGGIVMTIVGGVKKNDTFLDSGTLAAASALSSLSYATRGNNGLNETPVIKGHVVLTMVGSLALLATGIVLMAQNPPHNGSNQITVRGMPQPSTGGLDFFSLGQKLSENGLSNLWPLVFDPDLRELSKGSGASH
jgi:hypothetical protein